MYRSPASLLIAINSHCLVALPGTCQDVCIRHSHALKRRYCNLKWTLEDLLPCYYYTLKTNSKTIHSQVWKPTPGLSDKYFDKKLNSAKKRPEESQNNLLKARKKPNFICGIALPLLQRNIWITRNNNKFFSKLRLSLFSHCIEAHYWYVSEFLWFVTVILHISDTTVPQLAYWPIGNFLHPCESHLHSPVLRTRIIRALPPLQHHCHIYVVETQTCLQGRNEGGQGDTIPRAPNHYGGAESLRRAPKSPNNVTNTFFNTAHLLPKDSGSNTGGCHACFLPRAPSDLVAPLPVCKRWACLVPSTQYTLQSSHISSGYAKTLFRNPHPLNITYIRTKVSGQSINSIY